LRLGPRRGKRGHDFSQHPQATPEGVAEAEAAQAPAYFADLNLDQIVASVTAGKKEYNRAPFFHEPLSSREAIEYRQEVMRDLEKDAHYDAVARFAGAMRSVREEAGP